MESVKSIFGDFPTANRGGSKEHPTATFAGFFLVSPKLSIV